jgi:phage-related protein
MNRKPLVWLAGEVKTPPFSKEGRIATGVLLCRLQMGEALTMPESRPMPSIGRRCHELRVSDTATSTTWRIIYRVDRDAVIVGEVFAKKTQRTPKGVIENSKRRFREYDRACGD